MTTTLKNVFEEQLKHLVIDEKFLMNLNLYQIEFVNKNSDHISFFGSHLMGVNQLRFRPTDRDKWFSDVLEIGELELTDEIKKVNSIDESWVRASDAMNLSCIWIPHAIYKSKLNDDKKYKGLINNFLILQYKFLSSLMAHWYPYPVSKEVMEAAYSELSRKFALKKAGSWNQLLYSRAEELASKKTIHYQTFLNFNDDAKIIYAVSDIQNRLREIVKSFSTIFHEIRKQGKKISVSKSTINELDGSSIIKDKTKKYDQYIRYIQTIAADENSFIKEEIIDVIVDALPTVSPNYLKTTLLWITKNYKSNEKEVIENLLSEILIHAFDVIFQNRQTLSGNKNIVPLLTKLKSLYMASKMANPNLIKNKEQVEIIVKKAIKTSNSSAIASIRTALQLYIVTRTLAMDYYQKL